MMICARETDLRYRGQQCFNFKNMFCISKEDNAIACTALHAVCQCEPHYRYQHLGWTISSNVPPAVAEAGTVQISLCGHTQYSCLSWRGRPAVVFLLPCQLPQHSKKASFQYSTTRFFPPFLFPCSTSAYGVISRGKAKGACQPCSHRRAPPCWRCCS
jgi:hypothetical protein